MIRIARRWLPILLVLAFSVSVHAEVDRAAVVAQLTKLSGVDDQMDSYAENQAKQILAQAQLAARPGVETALADAARKEFAESLLLEDVRRALLAHYDAKRMAATLRWLTSPAGRRLTKLEERGSKALEQEGIENYAARMTSEPPSPDRIALVQKLDQTLKSSEHAASVVIEMAHATIVAYNAVSASPVLETRVRTDLEAGRSQIQHEIAEVVFLTMLAIYEDASDEDLAAYIAFSQTPEGRWYNETVSQALLGSLEKAGGRMAKSAAILATQPAAIESR